MRSRSRSCSGENKGPLMIWVERDDVVVPETPGAVLVEIEEDGRTTPQIVGEMEWMFVESRAGRSMPW